MGEREMQEEGRKANMDFWQVICPCVCKIFLCLLFYIAQPVLKQTEI